MARVIKFNKKSLLLLPCLKLCFLFALRVVIKIYNSIYHLMIVPQFKLKQSDSHVIVYIRVPYIKVSACEFYIEAMSFKFYLKPYLLSLTFQQPLKEVEEPAKAIYYHQKYLLEVHLEKLTAGQFFQNLDLLVNILNCKKGKKKNKVAVEVVGEINKGVLHEESDLEPNHFNYGFSMNYSNVLDHLDEEALELFQFDLKATPLEDRHLLSNQILIREFDFESYLFDKYQNQGEISSILKDKNYRLFLDKKVKEFQSGGVNSGEFKIKMKGKELLVSKRTRDNIVREIFTLVFSYVYELICMSAQLGPESARTINKTSLILSASCYYYSMPMRSVVIDCIRRCLTYSLYKSLSIAFETLNYVSKILDVKYLTVILLQIKELFQRSQPRYLLNTLFIDDYLTYSLAGLGSPQALERLRTEISDLKILEDDLELGISEYEKMEQEEEGAEGEQEEGENKKLVEELSNLNVLN